MKWSFPSNTLAADINIFYNYCDVLQLKMRKGIKILDLFIPKSQQKRFFTKR